MPNLFTKEEIHRFWCQIVTEKGKDAFSSDEWQKIYEDFLRCMHSDAKPFIKIDTLSELKLGNLRTKPVYMSDIIANRRQAKTREDGPQESKGTSAPTDKSEPMIDKSNEE